MGAYIIRRVLWVLLLLVLVSGVTFFIFTVLQVWDARVVLLLLAIAVLYYRSGSIPWSAIRRNWGVVFVFIRYGRR